MSIISPAAGEAFHLRCTSFHETQPDKKWNNHLVVVSFLQTDQDALRDVATAFGNFVSLMSQITTYTEKVTVSTKLQDSNPYNGNEFFVQPINLPGGRAISGADKLPLTVCLYLAKEVNTGHRGKLFIRGMLTEADVVFGSTLFALNNPSSMSTLVVNAAIDSGLNSFMVGNNVPVNVAMVPPGNASPNPRPVIGMSVQGVRNVSINHKYFTRS